MNMQLVQRVCRLEEQNVESSDFFRAWAAFGVPYCDALARGGGGLEEALAAIHENLPDGRADLLISFCDDSMARVLPSRKPQAHASS